jgi:predicted RNA-binding Zn ribbon-like protein
MDLITSQVWYTGNVMPGIKTQPHKQRSKQGRRSDFPRLLGGNLCLDFVNTVEGRLSPHPQEFLNNYADLVHWGEHVNILSSDQASFLLERAKTLPADALACFNRALALRTALHRIFLAQVHHTQPSHADLDILKQAYLNALWFAELSPAPEGYRWHWRSEEIALESVLWDVAQAAVTLLCSNDVHRVKECPGANDCGWLFFDTSKNLSRRWCSMEGCGSRVKMRRQYAKKNH